jgi:PhnB protein
VNVRSLNAFLTVRNASAAIEYYRRAFGATEKSRLVTPTGQIVAEMRLQGLEFGVVDENPGAQNLSPEALGGTSVRLSLIVDDPDAAADRAVAAGGRVLFPVADQPYGMRQGRIVDPFGHHWLIGKVLAHERP